MNYVSDQLVAKLMAVMKPKAGKCGINVKNHLWLFINCLVENPEFDSLTKEKMTLTAKAFGSTCELSEKFINGVRL